VVHGDGHVRTDVVVCRIGAGGGQKSDADHGRTHGASICYAVSMRSPWSVGLIMILFAGIGLTNLGQPHPPLGPAQWIVCGSLLLGGLLMFLNRPWSRWVAVAAALVLVASGALAMKRPEFGLYLQPAISIVIGFYIVLRTLMVKGQRPPKPTEPSA
jgi:hypothetical protein